MGTTDWIFEFLNSTEISEFVWRYYINRFETGWFMPSAHAHKATEIIYVIDGCV
jgi:hypothetical protein